MMFFIGFIKQPAFLQRDLMLGHIIYKNVIIRLCEILLRV